ncbi:metal-dependent hydrolase [Natrinema sp. CBA1119]|uniref:metal-dependent hydrolase n=1 Tax=unclassified Natrinema TaxID=2622230 RepID=UPI000BF78F5B|nr:metal-dependent hydrolase [Natrinema sp. CBA1119]PGF17598.1 metal-dependent hydrolase [Natrinema sp. CBA1119]
MELERGLFLAGAFATHAFVGYALVRGLTDEDPRIGLVFGLLPDADFLFPAGLEWPFVHRGITHTPLFALAIVIGGYAVGRRLNREDWRGRGVAVAVGLAIGSHLAIDSLSPKGIDWLFPLRTSWSPGLAVHSPAATVVLWAASIGILAWGADELPSIR